MAGDKLDQVLTKLNDLQEQFNDMQAVLLKLSKRQGVGIGKSASGKAGECPTSGCEDQCSACQE
jgi:hypothetical protein